MKGSTNCPVGACPRRKRPDDLMCRADWERVPHALQQAVLDAKRVAPSGPAHQIAARAAVRAVTEHMGGPVSRGDFFVGGRR